MHAVRLKARPSDAAMRDHSNNFAVSLIAVRRYSSLFFLLLSVTEQQSQLRKLVQDLMVQSSLASSFPMFLMVVLGFGRYQTFSLPRSILWLAACPLLVQQLPCMYLGRCGHLLCCVCMLCSYAWAILIFLAAYLVISGCCNCQPLKWTFHSSSLLISALTLGWYHMLLLGRLTRGFKNWLALTNTTKPFLGIVTIYS